MKDTAREVINNFDGTIKFGTYLEDRGEADCKALYTVLEFMDASE
jgi:hypothetical protein